MNAAEELREAARLLRERAEKATPGPWASLDGGDRLVAWKPDGDGDFDYVIDEPIGNADNADYIALMHPGVGLALADFLDVALRTVDVVQGLDGSWPPFTAAALTIARAVLATTGGPS